MQKKQLSCVQSPTTKKTWMQNKTEKTIIKKKIGTQKQKHKTNESPCIQNPTIDWEKQRRKGAEHQEI